MTQAVSRTPAALARRDLSARQAIAAACAALAAVTVLDLMDGHLGLLFSVGFVLVAVTVPFAVDVRSLFPAGVLPPVLLLVSLFGVCMLDASTIHVSGLDPDTGPFGTFVASVVDHGTTLVVGHGLALAAIVWRIVNAPER